MPIDRENLKTGDIFLKRADSTVPKANSFTGWAVEKLINFFEWWLSRSPEFYHVGCFYDKFTAFETNPPRSRKFSVSDLDSDFDKGLVCIMRPKHLSVSGEMSEQTFMDKNLNLPYGLETIGYEALLGIDARFSLYKLVNWLRSKNAPGDWRHRPICSQLVYLVETIGGELNLHVPGNRGMGQIVPGDFYTMTDDFYVVQDLKK